MDRYGMTPPSERLDLHNSGVDELSALNNLCGYQDLRTGRVCRLPARHAGSCRFVPKPLPGEEWPADDYLASWPLFVVEDQKDDYSGPWRFAAVWPR